MNRAEELNNIPDALQHRAVVENIPPIPVPDGAYQAAYPDYPNGIEVLADQLAADKRAAAKPPYKLYRVLSGQLGSVLGVNLELPFGIQPDWYVVRLVLLTGGTEGEVRIVQQGGDDVSAVVTTAAPYRCVLPGLAQEVNFFTVGAKSLYYTVTACKGYPPDMF